MHDADEHVNTPGTMKTRNYVAVKRERESTDRERESIAIAMDK